MTAIRGFVPATTDRRVLGVHSLDRFALAVPDLAPAQRFYADFGLDVQAEGNALALRTFGYDQRWGTVVEGKRKRLHHLSFGCYPDDLLHKLSIKRAHAGGQSPRMPGCSVPCLAKRDSCSAETDTARTCCSQG
jgi:hypothetical protein